MTATAVRFYHPDDTKDHRIAIATAQIENYRAEVARDVIQELIKVNSGTAAEIVKFACDTADALANEFAERGWLVEIPESLPSESKARVDTRIAEMLATKIEQPAAETPKSEHPPLTEMNSTSLT